ncbi:hypothetical protein F511_23376 [Dorcoceras hygrometricum]|uniref:Uncharacterized protein n=1 Tax=Dorcoceras hygrometricum TaxID=472368 RepID=A0A2Z7D8C7_9LAMI|nr:hypothetical protein F511_23376 [Dorcoceras hygrometricum]
MAASLIQNSLQVNFDSVLSLSYRGMVSMFKSLESSGFRGFLGCSAVIYELDLDNFFGNAFVRGNTMISSVQEKFVEISEDQFAGSPRFDFGRVQDFPTSEDPYSQLLALTLLKNKSVSKTAEEVLDEPAVEKVVKAAVKRRPDPTAEPVAKKKRTTVGRAAPTEKNLAIVPVVQEAVPISVIPGGSPTVQTRKSPKRKLILQEDSDEEATDEQ